MGGVLVGPLQALRLIGVVVRYVMNFMTGVKPLQDLQSPDLSAPGGRVQKVTLDPENLHAIWAARADTGMRPWVMTLSIVWTATIEGQEAVPVVTALLAYQMVILSAGRQEKRGRRLPWPEW